MGEDFFEPKPGKKEVLQGTCDYIDGNWLLRVEKTSTSTDAPLAGEFLLLGAVVPMHWRGKRIKITIEEVV